MAVVTKYGSGARDPAAVLQTDATYAEAKVFHVNSKIDITNGDSIASKFFVGRVPTNAILSPLSRMDYEAVAGVTTMDVGFAGAVAALVAAKDVSSAGNASAVSAVAVANLNKRVWELAGLAADPGGMLDIFATLNAAATATKSIVFSFLYSRK